MFEVVRHHPGFPVGDVLELVAVRDVAQGVHAVHRLPVGEDPEVAVHGQGAVPVQVKAGSLHAQPVRVRHPPRGHQDDIRRDAKRRAIIIGENDRDRAVAVVLHSLERVSKLQPPAAGGCGCETPGDLPVVAAKQSAGTVYLGDVGAEAMEHRGKLRRDVAAAHDHHSPRQAVNAHDGIGGMYLREADPRNFGQDGPGTGGHYYPVRGEFHA